MRTLKEALLCSLVAGAFSACSADGVVMPQSMGGDGSASGIDASVDLSIPGTAPDLIASLPKPDKLELWYWHGSYLTTNFDSRVAVSEALIDRAAAAGYTGIAFYDSSFPQILRAGFDTQYEKRVVDHATAKGLKTAIPAVGMGAAGAYMASKNDSPLGANPNWAEGPHVVGAQFNVVAGGPTGLQLQSINSVTGQSFGDGTFESGVLSHGGGGPSTFTAFDDRVTIDMSGCHGGSHCGHIANGGAGNERFYHAIALTPARQYHLSMWVKVVGYVSRGGSWPHISLLDAGSHDLLNSPFPTSTNMSQWQKLDFSFNSKSNTQLTLIFGIWGGFAAGDIWVDDVALEEVALENVTRRDNTPLRMYKATDKTVVYTEGVHFQPISDPIFLGLNGNLDTWHAPPAVSILPVAGAPKIGDIVAIDYSAVMPFYETIGYAPSFACLTEPGVQDFNRRVAAALSTIFPPDAGFFMGYDEMRVIDNCDGCKALGTPGEVLAKNAATMTDLLVGAGGVRPGARAYTWSDMFDAYHNAHGDYYQVDGDLAGSWKGLPGNVIIFNWHPLGDVFTGKPSDLTQSLKFFAGQLPEQTTPHQQIISGYYDPGLTGNKATDDARGCTQATMAFAKASGVPGVLGLMYTTWASDYSQLEGYATCARQAWEVYKKSLP